MDSRGDFVSPGRHSPGFTGSTINQSKSELENCGESFSKEQIEEIEQLLNRIDAGSTEDDLLLEDAQQTDSAQEVRPTSAPRTTSDVAPQRKAAKNIKSDEKERIWQAHIKDVRSYLEAKKSTTTQAILQERKFRKEAHLKQPWQRVRRNTSKAQSGEAAALPPTEYFVTASDLKEFIESRSL